MEMIEVIRSRHSVRKYKNDVIENEKRLVLNNLIDECNKVSGLKMQICYDEMEAFDTFMAHYGRFDNVKNYIAIVAKKGMEEKVGYYGEKIVLKAQELGLNTCWVALTYGKGKVKVNIEKDEKLICVISVGYGESQGFPHKSKKEKDIVVGEVPEWAKVGVEACLLAPTAVNQQKFRIIFDGNNVAIVKRGIGFYTDVDLGIVKCHFEAATGIKVIDF